MGERVDRRAARREATIAEIVDAAWALAAEHGLSGVSMRELAARVHMRAPSLYTYFASKHEIFDAMFAQAAQVFAHEVAATFAELDVPGADARAVAHEVAHRFFRFCTEDVVRYQLLFQRTLPGFEPSPASYAAQLEAYAAQARWFSRIGVRSTAALDLWTAVLTGLASQQIANDPGGRRWAVLVDRAVDMVLADIAPTVLAKSARGRRRPTAKMGVKATGTRGTSGRRG